MPRHPWRIRAAASLMVFAAVMCACSSSKSGSADSTVAAASVVPDETTPAETTPAETTPAETTPAETTPAETTPAETTPSTPPTPAGGRIVTETVADRPFEINVPAGFDESTPVPLVVVLHGYTGSGAGAKEYFGLEAEARKRGFLTVYPDGTEDSSGNQFWNATDACCQLTASESDDSAYLTALIDRVEAKFSVDPKRVYLAGHSNGGFMSYRMACEHADRIAAIVSVAGATFADVASCKPSEPVSVLQVHGTNDTVISFTGGAILNTSYPGAQTSVATWAAYNGCGGTPAPGAGAGAKVLDLDDSISGKDSSVTASAGCQPGGAAELWSIDGGTHEPKLTAEFAASITDFLLAHPKS